MQIAHEQFNPYAQAAEEAQGEIRLLVKRAYLRRMPKNTVNKELGTIIETATKDIAIRRLKEDMRTSLLNFANKQRILWQTLSVRPEVLLFLSQTLDKAKPPLPSAAVGEALSQIAPDYVTDAVGVPLQTYYRDVWKLRVQPVLERIAREQALDPNDFTGRNSLRNLAEMEVRYHDHQDSIESLRRDDVRLVVCSAHADCSDRCAKWQGRIYSLDGTSGTIDGHRYVPLEEATDVWYTTKAGRRYKNGLLGFNCRHSITAYRGHLLPKVSAEERKKEYAVTMRQRELERAVRTAKAYALENKDLNGRKYREYSGQARKLYAEYIKFSADNNRAYYPMRVRI